jgi:lysophospholipase L1-like esterase
VTGLAAAALFAGGATVALSGKLGTPIGEATLPTPTPVPAARSGVFHLVALGDSLTRGTGDGEGGGYPARVAAELRKGGKTVDVENVAVDGAETTDLLKKLDEAAVLSRIRSADLILLSIGGNDLTHSMPGLTGGGDPGAAALSRARQQLLEILKRLRDANATAPIRLLGLYNPFRADGDARAYTRQVLLLWNVAIEEATFSSKGTVVVPTSDLFEERPERLSSDRFHPGPDGYAEIAARVVSSLPGALVKSGEARAAR